MAYQHCLLKILPLVGSIWCNLNAEAVRAQSVRSFFQPTRANNYASYVWLDHRGKVSPISRIITYADWGDTLVVADIHSMFSTVSNETVTTSSATLIYTFSNKSVIMNKSITVNILGEDQETMYGMIKPIVLKMPLVGKAVSWSYLDPNKEKWDCSATWTKIYYQGSHRNAIRVVKACKQYLPIKLVDYYVEGLGLYKTQLINGKGVATTRDLMTKLEWSTATARYDRVR